jgi:hypothetical protein
MRIVDKANSHHAFPLKEETGIAIRQATVRDAGDATCKHQPVKLAFASFRAVGDGTNRVVGGRRE